MRRLALLLWVLCLVVSPTTHAHGHGARRDLGRSSAEQAVSTSPTTTCPAGLGSGNKLPLVHRLSPCSPLASGGARKHGKPPSLHETLHRDGLRLRYLSKVQAAAGLSSVPATQNVISSLSGVYDYTVMAGYGTPAQPLPFYFDFSGMSNLRCKPCFSSGSPGGGAPRPCGPAFDPSRSSSFRSLTCGSPDCTELCSPATGPCAFTYQNSTFVFGNGTVATDTLTLSPSATFDAFAAGCLQLDNMFISDGDGDDGVAVGNIDLSRSRHSLATRVLAGSSTGTAAFSYCLPADTDTHDGFLTIAPTLSDYSDAAGVKYVPLVTNPSGPNFYYVDLVAIAVDGEDLAFPPAEFRANGTMIDSQAAFTYLNPPIYAALRDEFRAAMARRRYPPAPAFGGLDTCYNFTGVVEKEEMKIYLPDITLRFGNGEAMDLDDTQFMYFFRDHLDDAFAFGCLAFGAAAEENFLGNLLGSQVQRTREIVFDVLGGKVAFVPSRCGVR